ncbi:MULTISPECIES: cell division protein ZapA [Caproicibacterium]|uniref:Cell division protein ZapA n=1 Tax=Caproicibacterium argilliputei TaxID=3030016 RepID=A0AA97D9X3_9FIRM|nr:cell division protein ZapA [Caproicibacterium argilliputei]WOC32337.1 cell division protein ZapA [Caproicibacterium argilliputei]
MSKNSIRLTICGTECAVGTDDNEAYVRSIASEVQDCMQNLSRQNETASGAVIAIVAALSFCDDYHKANQTAETLREQIKGYLEDSSQARLEAETAQKEVARLKQEVASLRARLGEADADASDSVADAPVQRTSGSFSRPKREDGEPEGAFLQHFEEKEEPLEAEEAQND